MTFDFPRIFWVHAFHFNCDLLRNLAYRQLSAGNVIFYTYEHSPFTGTPVSSESSKISPQHFGVANFLSKPLSYLAPLGSENISAPYFKQCFFQGWGWGCITPQTESNTTPPSPKTEITNILFYILNFASIIKFKM